MTSKLVRFFQIFVTFSENLNFIVTLFVDSRHFIFKWFHLHILDSSYTSHIKSDHKKALGQINFIIYYLRFIMLHNCGHTISDYFLATFCVRSMCHHSYNHMLHSWCFHSYGNCAGGGAANAIDYYVIVGSFNNYVDRILTFFDPPPCVDSFYTLSVDKNRHFWPPPPLILST